MNDYLPKFKLPEKILVLIKSRDKKFYYKKKFMNFRKTDPAGSRESKNFFCPA
jgi:hypothetical protein